KKDGSEVASKSRQRTNPAVGLPPPPGGVKIAPPPAKTPTSSPAHKPLQSQNQDVTSSEWGEFASASQSASASAPAPAPASTVANASWVQF
ncbi:PREDICTED: NECAP-like protein CG9132, partial [Atta cephalotes]|uniref:NECAP PHear domain-containing protein n=1 Tax=Atta cephalotes TaxID=12957 RepID=A0A158NWW4_ATTCE